jgi:parvulin-like peptidyl-prolyl isomerase
MRMHKPRQLMLALALVAASLSVRAQAPSPQDAEATYPANRLRCVVVAGSSVRYADAKAQELVAIINRSIANFVNEEFNERHYESFQVFHEPDDVVKSPPQWMNLMVRQRCGHLVQIAYEASDDAAGPYFSWDVQVIHLDRRSSTEARATLVTVGDYQKRYRYQRSPTFFASFIMSDFAHTVVEDLMASGALPGLHAAGSVTEGDVRALYERFVSRMARSEHATRHILAATQEQAQAALNRIQAGESFSVVAQAVSQDPGSKQAGGELGWSAANAYAPEFAAAVKALAPRGLIATPVKSRFGWHVIEVTDTRRTSIPDFESKREQLTAVLAEKDRKREALPAPAR